MKTLPRDKQEQIIVWLDQGTQKQAAETVLKEFNIDTSPAALSEFYSWYFLSRQLQQVSEFSTEIKETLRDLPELSLTEDKLSAAGQAIFEAMAIKQQDQKLFLGLRAMRMAEKSEQTKRDVLAQRKRESEGRAHVKTRELELAERRVALLEKKEAEAKKTLGDTSLTPVEQAARIKQIFGIAA